MLDYLIIDITYSEFNRGGYGYLPYILYSALKEKGYNVEINEDFTLPQTKELPEAKEYLIALWAYPQIDLATVLYKFIPSDNVSFFGYYPLIDHLNFPKKIISNDTILLGIKNYPKYFKDFKYLLLCEDDMHLAKYDGIVYPLFTSYGCGNGCAFCPLTVNCQYKRIELSAQEAIESLQNCYNLGVRNIHFTDDDFFHNTDRAFQILLGVYGLDMKFIALGTVGKVQKFLDKHGERPLKEAGIKIIEIGLETADETVASLMHKPKANKYVKLYNSLKEIDIFWLTLSFFPGETISSLNTTGLFLSKYGHNPEDMYSRIATNSSEGGLGQFMQLYHGVREYEKLKNLGIHINDRPIRLLPSFVPHSFLESKIKKHRSIKDSDLKWFKPYKVNPHKYEICDGKMIKELTDTSDGYIFYAICARLRIIE